MLQATNSADRRPPLPALTGVRAFAAYGPILWHAQHFTDDFLPVARHGYLGVDLFFMLSGFVLAYVHGDEMRQPRWPLYGRFLALRLGRIWPAYLVVLLLVGASLAWREQWWSNLLTPEQGRFVIHIFMLQNWGLVDPNEFNWPAWSVSAEWLVYLLFPVFVICLYRASRSIALLAIPILVVVMGLAFLADGQSGLNAVGWIGLVRAALEFAIGFLLWRLFSDPVVQRWNWNLIGAACLIALAVLLAVTGPRSLTDLLFVALFAPLLLSLAFARGLLAKICAWRPLVFLGEASYCIYLVHFPILWKVAAILSAHADGLPDWLARAIGIAATALGATIAGVALHLVVERPCRRYVRHRLGYAA